MQVAVAEEEQESSEEDAEGEDAEEGGGEPSPDGEGETLPGHAFAAKFDDGGEGVDAACGGGDGEDRDAGQPEIHADALAGAGEWACGEGRVGCPAGDGCAGGDEEGRAEDEQG